MKPTILIISMTLLMTACQTGSFRTHDRDLASSQPFAKFIRVMAADSPAEAAKIEKSIISYIQRHDENMTTPNYEIMGLTKDEAMSIKSLSDDTPAVLKSQRWILKNNNIVKIDPKLAKNNNLHKAYAEIGHDVNPYAVNAPASAKGKISRAGKKSGPKLKSISPIKSIDEENGRIIASIQEDIPDAAMRDHYIDTYSQLVERAGSSPYLLANAQDMMSSAIKITKKSGINAIGEGCMKFNKTASAETLSIKANIDARTVERLTDIDLAGKSKDEIEELVSTARARSFSDTLGYTDDEAIAAVRRLQRAPCRVY